MDKFEFNGHTPGPWSVSGPTFGLYHVSSDHSVGGQPCQSGRQAICTAPAASKRNEPEYAAMFAANAGLIAAAPALLAEIDRLRAELAQAKAKLAEHQRAERIVGAIIERNGDGALDAMNQIDKDDALAQLAHVSAKLEQANETLHFVERWANHHAQKPSFTAEAALSVIQHYPPIKAITASYADGKVPNTPDPWAERDAALALLRRCRPVVESEAAMMDSMARHMAGGFPEKDVQSADAQADFHAALLSEIDALIGGGNG